MNISDKTRSCMRMAAQCYPAIINKLRQFEEAMVVVHENTCATVREMKALREKIRKVSEETEWSSYELASTMGSRAVHGATMNDLMATDWK